jgi:hypothetical protein
MIRHPHIVLIFTLLLAGCGVSSKLQSTLGNKYRYSASMVAPAKSKEMLFRDDRIIIQFRLDDPALRFQIQNISPGAMSIDWPNASLGVHGVYSPVRNMATLYDSTGTRIARQVVPSLGVLRDVILPRANIYFDGRRWRGDDLFPTTDANSRAMRTTILNLIGASIDVNLPIDFGTESRPYHFTFAVDTVRQVAWDAYEPTGWLPASPPVHGLRPSSEDQVTSVILVGGFIGFFRYMITAKKTPVSE